MPVLVFDRLDTASDHVNHEFSGVSLGGTLGSVLAKVLLDGHCIVTDVPKVDCLSALGKEKKGVELSEKLRRGLMDSDLECMR